MSLTTDSSRASGRASAPEPSATRLSPTERIAAVCDRGSLQVIGSEVRSRRIGDKARPGDGVVAASGEIDGRPVFVYAQDGAYIGGSLGEAQADTIARVLGLAGRSCVPVVGLIESAGARVQEATAALGGYARLFRATVELSGKVPQISVVSGMSAGGGAYAPALTDFIVMTRSANMFLTGPQIVREALGEDVSASDLGGAKVHSHNGVCQFVADDDAAAAHLVRELLSFLPQNQYEPPPLADLEPAPGGDPSACMPHAMNRVYDVRIAAREIVDGGRLLEVSPRWARNMVTAFARLEGRPVGIVANQPHHLGGVIDAVGSEKAASFIRTCDKYCLPLVVLVDTPGFLPGSREEKRAVIRHGADLLHAFASASVPKLSVILRQAYGGAYITMNCKDLGADFAYAWPDARVGVMGARQAVAITHRREISASPDPDRLREALAERYAEEHQSAESLAQEGFVDEIIEPTETRDRLCSALKMLGGRRA